MLIIIRADASLQMGSGHIMRCLTLAEVLRDLGETVEFVTRNHSGNLNDFITSKKFKVHLLPNLHEAGSQQNLEGYEQWLGVKYEIDAIETIDVLLAVQVDLLIVDHYALGYKWEKKIREYVKKIVVIDDLANRNHDCDILLDQTFGRQESDYDQCVPEYCKLLVGSSYALLRPDFKRFRSLALQRRETHQVIKRVMVLMGGMDEVNMTQRVLNALSLMEWVSPPIINVVLSSGAPHLKEINDNATKYSYQVNVLSDITNMAELMLESDLSIGGGGTTTWERCCMALPTILIILADNQKKIGENLAQIGATITIHDDSNLNYDIKQALTRLMHSKKRYAIMSLNASKICDGGGAKRTVKKILSIY
jgi:UDP-2,4-diacetamido-2,4,6-trideoxy-beta-L-altropyranose hydrolase